MKHRILCTTVILLSLSAFTARGTDVITTLIDGTDTGRTITKIAFDGSDLLKLTFSDNTTETADMSLVEITFGPAGGSALEEIKADPKRPQGVYNLKGQWISARPEGLMPGVYIVNGEKIIVK